MPNPSPDTRAKLEKLMADPRYWDGKHPEHPQAVTAVQCAFEEAYPEPSAGTIHVLGYTRRQDGKIVEVSDYERSAPQHGDSSAPVALPPKSLSFSEEGLTFLTKKEGFKVRTYRDDAEHPTIGFGHRLLSGESYPNGITREEARHLLSSDVRQAVEAVRRNVHVDLTQPQFDALVSFTYNVGATAFAHSTPLRRLNAGDAKGAAEEFKRWVHIPAEPEPDHGLTNRRNAERNLFLNGAYE